MSHDGYDEGAAIKARLLPLAGGRWFEGQPDSAQIERYPDGTVKPYGIITSGESLAAARGRSLGAESSQPHILPVSVTYIANSADTVKRLSRDGGNLLIGWSPNPPNSGEMRARGGNQWVSLNANLAPSEFHRIRYMECDINMIPAPNPS